MVLQDRFQVSQRRPCRLAGQNRNTQRRPAPVAAIEEKKLRQRILELARRHVRWGRRLVYRRLRLDAWSVNHNWVQRIWRDEGLQRPLPRRRKRCQRLIQGRIPEPRTVHHSAGSQAVGGATPNRVQHLQTACSTPRAYALGVPPAVESGLATHQLSKELDQ